MTERFKTIWRQIRLVSRDLSGRQITVHAASACFFMVLAFFPMLVLLMGLVRYAGYSADNLMELFEGVLPGPLWPAAEKLIRNTYRNTTGTMVSVSALTALWSAGRGIYGVLRGMNAAYQCGENRGYFYTRGMSVVYTFVFLLILLLTLVLHVFGKGVSRWLLTRDMPLFNLVGWVVRQRFFLLLLLQTVIFCLMYMFLPNQKNRFADSLPGALFAAVGWQLVSIGFSFYVEKFTAYTNIYGSVYAVAMSLLWLYICVCLLFCGGVLNHWLMENQEQ